MLIRTSVVPLPASAWFMLSALGLLATRRLRKDRVS
ncbi:PEP-CTERM sorting domain-containing protein [Methylicorpusculum oleiharenae]